MSEVNREESPVGAGGAVGITRPKIVVIGQDDGLMWRVVHPPGHGALRVVRGSRAGVDDLSAPPAGIAGCHLTLPIRGTIRASVRQEIIGRLVFTVDSGGVLERIGIRQRPQADQGALVVDQYQ